MKGRRRRKSVEKRQRERRRDDRRSCDHRSPIAPICKLDHGESREVQSRDPRIPTSSPVDCGREGRDGLADSARFMSSDDSRAFLFGSLFSRDSTFLSSNCALGRSRSRALAAIIVSAGETWVSAGERANESVRENDVYISLSLSFSLRNV